MHAQPQTRFVVRAPIAGAMIYVADFETLAAADEWLHFNLWRIQLELGVPYVETREELRSDVAKA